MALLKNLKEKFKVLYVKYRNSNELDFSQLKYRLIQGESTSLDSQNWERTMKDFREYINDIIDEKGIDPSKGEFIVHRKSYYLAYLLLYHDDGFDYNTLKENTYWAKYITVENIDTCFYKIAPTLTEVGENVYVIGVKVYHKTETSKPSIYSIKEVTYYDLHSFDTIRMEENKDFDLEEYKNKAREVANLWEKTFNKITNRNCVTVLELEELKGSIENGIFSI